MTPGASVSVLGRGQVSHIVKIQSSLPLGIDQTFGLYSDDDQGRVYQNCKFHYP